jgi:hypothetical protein
MSVRYIGKNARRVPKIAVLDWEGPGYYTGAVVKNYTANPINKVWYIFRLVTNNLDEAKEWARRMGYGEPKWASTVDEALSPYRRA